MRIKAFSDIDCVHPAPRTEILIECAYKELVELIEELKDSLDQQVKIVISCKDREEIAK